MYQVDIIIGTRYENSKYNQNGAVAKPVCRLLLLLSCFAVVAAAATAAACTFFTAARSNGKGKRKAVRLSSVV